MAVVALAAGLACSGEAEFGNGSMVTDSSGVRIVRYSGPNVEVSFTAREVARLVPPDSALAAFPWGVSADARLGQIYIADRTTPRVLVFEDDGQFRHALGREGRGPGEWVSPNAVSLATTGEVVVWDIGRNVLSRWTASGTHESEIAAPVTYWGPGFAFDAEEILAVTSSTAGSTMDQQLVRISGDGAVVIHSVPRTLEQVELPCGAFPMSPIYAPDVIWTHGGEAVHLLHGPEYRIDRYVGGNFMTSIRRDMEPVPVTEELAARRVQLEYGGFLERCGLSPEALVRAVGHAGFASPIQWMSVDPEGRVWVSRTMEWSPPIEIDIFGEDGQYEGTISASGMPVAWLSRTRFVGYVVEPETGETLISVQELVGGSQ